MMRIEDLHTRATLVALHITTWSARKFDRAVTNKINSDHGLAGDAGRYNKRLLAPQVGANDSYKALIRVCNAARTSHYENTLAWGDDGSRCLPSANYLVYMGIMRQHESDFVEARRTFDGDYPMLVDAARQWLRPVEDGGMFRESDYPSLATVSARFTFRIDPKPLPTAGDFRVTLPAAEMDALRAAVEHNVRQAADEAVSDARKRLISVVESIVERLSEPEKTFHDTLIGNARNLTDVLSRLNVMGDPEIEAMRQRVENELTNVEPQTLRDEPTIRKAVAQSAKKILVDMNQYSRRVKS